MVIPNISCDCGRTIQAWRQVKKGQTRVVCRCGMVWRLVKAGKPIIISQDPHLVPLQLLREIRSEREKGYVKWGHVDTSPVVLLSAITEEVGEVAHAVNHDEGNEKVKQEVAHAIGVLSRLWDMVSN